jgi:hypothetical protein
MALRLFNDYSMMDEAAGFGIGGLQGPQPGPHSEMKLLLKNRKGMMQIRTDSITCWVIQLIILHLLPN